MQRRYRVVFPYFVFITIRNSVKITSFQITLWWNISKIFSHQEWEWSWWGQKETNSGRNKFFSYFKHNFTQKSKKFQRKKRKNLSLFNFHDWSRNSIKSFYFLLKFSWFLKSSLSSCENLRVKYKKSNKIFQSSHQSGISSFSIRTDQRFKSSITSFSQKVETIGCTNFKGRY